MNLFGFLIKALFILPLLTLIFVAILLSLAMSALVFLATGRKMTRFKIHTQRSSDFFQREERGGEQYGPRGPMRDVTPKTISNPNEGEIGQN